MMKDKESMVTNGSATRVSVTALAAIALTAAAPQGSHRSPRAKLAAASVAKATAATPVADAVGVAIVDPFHAALTSGDTRTAIDLLVEDMLIFASGGVE